MARKVGRSWQSDECITACELRYRLRRHEDLFRFFVCAWIGISSPVSKLEGANKRGQLSKISLLPSFRLILQSRIFYFRAIIEVEHHSWPKYIMFLLLFWFSFATLATQYTQRNVHLDLNILPLLINCLWQ